MVLKYNHFCICFWFSVIIQNCIVFLFLFGSVDMILFLTVPYLYYLIAGVPHPTSIRHPSRENGCSSHQTTLPVSSSLALSHQTYHNMCIFFSVLFLQCNNISNIHNLIWPRHTVTYECRRHAMTGTGHTNIENSSACLKGLKSLRNNLYQTLLENLFFHPVSGRNARWHKCLGSFFLLKYIALYLFGYVSHIKLNYCHWVHSKMQTNRSYALLLLYEYDTKVAYVEAFVRQGIDDWFSSITELYLSNAQFNFFV